MRVPFAELGVPPEAASSLLFPALMGWQQAARVLGMTQPKLSGMLRGQFRGISEMKMMDCLIRLGKTVKIVVGPKGKPAKERIEVVAA